MPGKSRSEWNTILALVSAIVAIISIFVALDANQKSEQSNQLAKESNQIALESNQIARDANRITVEADQPNIVLLDEFKNDFQTISIRVYVCKNDDGLYELQYTIFDKQRITNRGAQTTSLYRVEFAVNQLTYPIIRAKKELNFISQDRPIPIVQGDVIDLYLYAKKTDAFENKEQLEAKLRQLSSAPQGQARWQFYFSDGSTCTADLRSISYSTVSKLDNDVEQVCNTTY
jgi:hypothetical protein